MRTILFLAAIMLIASSVLAFQPVFNTRIDYRSTFPGVVKAADLNNDGMADLAVCENALADSVEIFLNQGDGTYAHSHSYRTGQGYLVDLVIADFDNDGNQDLAVIPWNSYLFILRNAGDGSFTLDSPIGLSAQPSHIAAADLDGDGYSDLAITFPGISRIVVYRNDGTGHFQHWNEIPTGAGPTYFVANDFTGDGRPDFVVVNRDSQNINIIRNNGDSTFTRLGSISYQAYAIAAADFDEDGDLDFVAAGWTPNKNLEIFINNGNAVFTDSTIQPSISNTTTIRTGDINNDGHIDLALGYSWEDYSISLYFGNGNGTFQQPAGYYPSGDISDIAIADFDGDSLNDLAATDWSSNDILIFHNPGNSNFHYGEKYDIHNPKQICSGDINNDGSPDLVIGYALDSVLVLVNDGFGSYSFGPRFRAVVSRKGITLNDFNNDGSQDIAVAGFTAFDNVAVWYNDGQGNFPSHVTYSNIYPPTGIASGDFDLDGYTDLAVCDGTDSFTVFFADSTGNFRWQLRKQTGPGSNTIQAYDLNKDRYPDLIFGGGSTGNISVARNRRNRVLGPPDTYATNLYNPKFVMAKIGSDSIEDMVATGDSNAYSFVTLTANTANLYYQMHTQQRLLSNTKNLLAGDFNLDGYDDALFFYNSRNDFQLFLNNQAGAFVADGVCYGYGELSGLVLAVDTDRDGDLDIITTDNQGITIFQNQSHSVGVDRDPRRLPESPMLLASYPNPFNSNTVIEFYVGQASRVEIEIYNLLGQRICSLLDGYESPGHHSVLWNASGMPSGLYFARIICGDRTGSLKMMLLK